MRDSTIHHGFGAAAPVTCELLAEGLTVCSGAARAVLQVTVAPAQRPTERAAELRIVDLHDAGDAAGELGARLLIAGMLALFQADEQLQALRLSRSGPAAVAARLLALGARAEGAELLCIERGTFYQHAELFLASVRTPFPEHFVLSEGKRHPRRPPKPEGVLYRRRIAALDCEFSARTIDPIHDLTLFHRWMNEPRVSAFWEQAGSLDEQAAYLDKVAHDPHNLPVLGCFDGEPFGYFELYWSKEDRIAPYYQVDDYDRGLHMLVGEARFRGPERVKAWLGSLAHYLFLDDPRTRAVVAEPRSDNAKMIAYLRERGFHQHKLFDFPHKRAAMMVLPRETFFSQFCP